MLIPFDIKIAALNNINQESGPYSILCRATDLKEYQLLPLATKLLTDTELTIFQQRKSLMAQKEYIASRFLIKTLIAQHLNMPYQTIQVSFNHRINKLQALVNNSPAAINISLAHSKGWVFFAISDVRTSLGVDIEYKNCGRDILAVSEAFFHPNECEQLTQHSYEKFYQLWTLKESLAKAKAQSIFQLLGQDSQALLKKFRQNLGEYDNFQLAAIHNHEINTMPCYLLDLAQALENHHE